MRKWPTPRQVRLHYAALYKAHNRMQDALNAAHAAGVIHYEGSYTDEAPCWSHWQTWKRIEATTKHQLAEAMKREIMNATNKS